MSSFNQEAYDQAVKLAQFRLHVPVHMEIDIFIDNDDEELKQMYRELADNHNNKICKNPQTYDAKILGILIETNYGGQTVKGLKYFEKYDRNFIRELKRLFRDYFNRIIPSEDVVTINKAILSAIKSKIRSLQRTNSIEGQEYISALEVLKQEIIN